MTGGMVSLGPPVGGVVVFAHECEKIIEPKTSAMGMIGKNLDRNLFIFNILNICPYYALDAFYLFKLLCELFEVTHVMDIQVYISFKHSVFST